MTVLRKKICAGCLEEGSCYPMTSEIAAGGRVQKTSPEFISFWESRAKRLDEEVDRIRNSKERAVVYEELARIFLLKLDDDERAAMNFELAAVQNPSDVFILRQVFRFAWRRKDWRRAARMLESEIKQHKDIAYRSRLLLRRAWILERQLDRREDAATLYFENTDLNPLSLWSLSSLSGFLEQKGDLSGFRKICRKIDESGADEKVRRIFTDVLEEIVQKPGVYDVLTEQMNNLVHTIDDPSLKLSILGELGDLLECEYDDADGAAMLWSKVDWADETTVRRNLADLALRNPCLEKRIEHIENGEGSFASPDMNADLLRELADSYDESGDYAAAAAALEKALKIRPLILSMISDFYSYSTMIGDADLIVHAILSRAQAQKTGPRAARCYVEAARILEQKEKEAYAIGEYYAMALKADPDSLDAAEGLVLNWGTAKKWKELTDILISSADRCEEKKREVDLLEAAARISLEGLEDHKQGMHLLNRVLVIEPDNLKATIRLAALYKDMEEWQESAALYARLADRSDKEEIRRNAALQAAGLYARNLGNPQAAAPLVRQVLEQDPGDHEALYVQALVSRADGRLEQAGKIFRKIADGLSNPREKVPYLLELADMLIKDAGDISAGIKVLEESSAYPQGSKAVDRLVEIWKEQGARSRIAGLYRRHMDLLSPGSPAWHQRALDLAGLLVNELKRPEEAEEILDMIEDVWPDREEAVILRARILESNGNKREAEALIRNLININPASEGPLSAFMKMMDRAENASGFYRAAQALEVAGYTMDDESTVYSELKQKAVSMDGTDADLDVDAMLPKEINHSFMKIMKILMPAMDRLLLPSISEAGFEKSDRLRRSDYPAIFRILKKTGAWTGIKKLHSYVSGSSENELAVASSSPVSLILPRNVDSLETKQLLFDAAGVLILVHTGLVYLYRQPAQRIKSLIKGGMLAAGVKNSKIESLGLDDVEDECTDDLRPLLSRREKKKLAEEVGGMYVQEPVDWGKMKLGVEKLRARCGFAACLDIDVSLRRVWHREQGSRPFPDRTDGDFRQWIETNETARDLLSFSIGNYILEKYPLR